MENEKIFRIGNKFVINKPKTDEELIGWVKGMDSLDGKEITVTKENITTSNTVIIVYNENGRWQVRRCWCTLIEEQKELNVGEEPTVPELPKKRIYIAGKITGLCMGNVNRTFGRAKYLIESWGFEAVSPLNYCEDGTPWVDCMLTLLPILNTCDGIYLLDNWEQSDGARIEKKFAEKKGMFVIKEII